METINGNLISEAKLPSDTIQSYDIVLRSKIVDWRARVFVAEEMIKRSLHLKEMIHWHNEHHRSTEKLRFYEAYYNGEWKYDGPSFLQSYKINGKLTIS